MVQSQVIRCMILNPNKTKALVVSGSRTVNPPDGDLVLSEVSICASPNFYIFGVKFDSKLTFEDHMHGIVSQRMGILRFLLPILEYWSTVWGSTAECHLQLLEREVYSMARFFPAQSFLSLYHRCHVAAGTVYVVQGKFELLTLFI